MSPKAHPIGLALSVFLFSVVIFSGLALLFFQFTASTKWGKNNLWDQTHPHLTVEGAKLDEFLFGQYFLPGLWWWGAPLLASLASLALLQLPSRRSLFEPLSAIRRLLGMEVAGCTLGEVLMILTWGGINAVSFQEFLRVQLDYAETEKEYSDEPYWALKWHKVGFSIGYVSFFNFALVLFPVSRHSPLFDLAGLSFEKRIKYHRLLSHFALTVVTVHGIMFWLLWIIRGQWADTALKWGGGLYVSNNLAGGICLVFGGMMWISAKEYVRRKFFEVFYRCHIVGFIGFAIFANLHVPGFYYYLPAGLFCYVVDIVLRVSQQSIPVVVDSSVNSDGTITTVSLKTPKSLKTVGAPLVWVSCPRISVCQWHPVTPTISPDGNMTIRFKNYGKWTKELCAMSAAGQLSHLHIEGPNDVGKNEFAAEFLDYDYLIFCTGGIAITPVLSILEALNTLDIKTDKYPFIHVFWTVRADSELEAGLPSLKKFSRYYPGRVSLEIYNTGKTGSLQKHTKNSVYTFNPGLGLRQMLGIKSTPVLLDPLMGSIHLGLLYIVAYSAGFAGLLLGNSWRLEMLRSNQVPEYWKTNIISFVCAMLMSIGWVTLCVLPMHIIRAMSATMSHSPSKYEIELAKATDKTITIGERTNGAEVVERRNTGRPLFAK